MTEESATPGPFAGACPKCGHRRREDAGACTRCGLVFDKWTPELAATVVKLDDAGAALWAALQDAWQDEAKHEAFAKHCSAAGVLGAAGRCYRERLDQAPSDAIAVKMQERILSLATVGFTVTRAPPPRLVTREPWFWAVLGVCAIMAAIAGFVLGR